MFLDFKIRSDYIDCFQQSHRNKIKWTEEKKNETERNGTLKISCVEEIKKKQSSKEKWKQRRKKKWNTLSRNEYVCVWAKSDSRTHICDNIAPKQMKKKRLNQLCGVQNLNVWMLLRAERCHQNVIIDAELFSIFFSSVCCYCCCSLFIGAKICTELCVDSFVCMCVECAHIENESQSN